MKIKIRVEDMDDDNVVTKEKRSTQDDRVLKMRKVDPHRGKLNKPRRRGAQKQGYFD